MDLEDKSPWFKRSALAYVRTLQKFDIDFTTEEIVTVALSLLKTEDPSSTFSDDPFLSLPGDELPGFLNTSGSAIVLVSKPGCEPCDRIKSKVEKLIEEETVPTELPLVEVSGPDHAEFLLEQYDVIGAPTLLLFKHGHVDMRLVGSKHTKQLRSDIERVYSAALNH